jgi:hypothetical protein
MIRSMVATTVLAVLIGAAQAQVPASGSAPQAVFTPPAALSPSVSPSAGVSTSRGAGLVTGSPGSPQMVTIPGSAVPGMLLNNGNGTSTIMVPGGPSEVVPTPR